MVVATAVAAGGVADRSATLVPGVRAARDEVRVAGSEPESFDPALAGTVSTAAILANLYEGLTAFDPNVVVRPALARSWEADAEWRRMVFHLRDGLTFSDGSPLTSEDVVRSWLRLLDPARPSPLASLLQDIEGAHEYLSGANRDPASVGLRALPAAVEVRFRQPAPWFVAAAGSPSLAVVPPGIDPDGSSMRPEAFVGSGAYVLASADETALTLAANERFWAGRPSISKVVVVTDLGDVDPLKAFRDGMLDYLEIPSFEASWIAYDRTIGPALREEPPLGVQYYGFDASRAPFDDVRLRRAFALAVDWRGLARAAGPSVEPANSLVPPAVPVRSAADLLPPYDPDEARRLLAEAGYPGGGGFPDVVLETGGSGYDDAVRAALRRELGVTVRGEIVSNFLGRLTGADRPAFWSLWWVADYPDPYDFLGVLLGRGQVTNFGRWADPDFDAAMGRAATAATSDEQARAYADAERVVQADVPVIPVAYPLTWALAREGLLGAQTGGIGILRFAGLAWGSP